jgi:hypothetical protein
MVNSSGLMEESIQAFGKKASKMALAYTSLKMALKNMAFGIMARRLSGCDVCIHQFTLSGVMLLGTH